MLVSIIMPAHNAERFIGEAIDSVLAQTYPHWELIVMDDASTDQTAALVQSFQDERIRYFYTERLGRPSLVRNHASAFCQGELILFFDADDILFSHTVEKYVDALCVQQAGNPPKSVVYGFIHYIDEKGNPLPSAGFKLIPKDEGQFVLPKGYHHSWDRVAVCRFVGTPCLMVRRALLDQVGWFDDDNEGAEDMHLYLKLFMADFQGVTCIPAYIIHYRHHMNGITRRPDKMENLLKNHLKAIDWLFNHPDLPAEAIPMKPMAYARRYNYMAGVCLSQGYKSMALRFVIWAFKDKRINLIAWLRHCPTTIIRCLFPLSWDQRAKEWAVQFRDGALLGNK